ncbi:transglutaminase family protein [Microvirga massiliensis]|uniref:transglutaminase family protein n=1 Tax=Microvirga massiliensis TaxID=1033741 RepID=UPI0006605C0D|nr:transglutaminase family protein [Microvirga massiliensis]
MVSIGNWRSTLVCLLLAAFGSRSIAAEAPVNLLRLPQAELASTALIGDGVSQSRVLTDGDPASAASLSPGRSETVDLVFGFAGEAVAPERITVTLSKRGDAVPPARIEVLASTVSPQSGFRSLRTSSIEATTAVQTFAFMPTAARWIMVRLTAAKAGQPIALAEIEVLGRPGPPATVYAFSESPARAIDVLSRLATTSTVSLAVSPDERLAFERAKAGRLDSKTLADVALLASGVLDAAKRRVYLSRIDALETKAKAAVAATHNPTERADALLRWLHREALAKGYRSTQTSLSVLLDDKTFNCVSSAVLYNILALRLGLDVRAIEVPDHAFSIVYQGSAHVDVETTNPRGFNPARDPKQVQQFEQMTGFRYVPEAYPDKRREITEAGLAALIYYNKGVELNRTKHHHEALLAYFRAMSLDPEFASAAKNALATLANWSLELTGEQKWEQALEIATAGVALAPKDAALAHNQIAIWERWAMSLADKGQPEEAVAVLKRASSAVPNSDWASLQAWVYIKPGEDLIKARDWQAAFSATEAGLTKLDPGPREELVKWRDQLFLRWANSEIDAGRFDEAASVLLRGLRAAPDDQRLHRTIAYLAQEWADRVSGEGFTEGLAVLAGLNHQFPTVTMLQEAQVSYVWRQVRTLVEATRIEESLAVVEEADDLLKSPEEKTRLRVYVFDSGAKTRIKAGDWAEAASIYGRGLDQVPDSDLLRNNVVYLAQEWAKAASTESFTQGAAVLAGLKRQFPTLTALDEVQESYVWRQVKTLVEAGRIEDSLAAIEEASDLLKGQDERLRLGAYIFDSSAKARMKAGAWAEAAEIYAKGLQRLPRSDLLRSNAVYLAQEWARAAFESGGAAAVIPIVQQVADRFPDAPRVGEGPLAVVTSAVSEKVRAGEFGTAVALVEQAAEILPADRATQLYEFSYDRWAKSFMDKKQWADAVRIYDKGLQRLPSSSLLKQNKTYCLAQSG